MPDSIMAMMDRHHHTPLADLDAAYATISEWPWNADRDYRILRALRIPVAPMEVRKMEPLLGEHFCFFGARDPKWKTWFCTGYDLAPRSGPPWYAEVQEAELVLNIEAWVWYRAKDALYKLIRELGGTSDWDYGNYSYIDQHTYFVHLPSSKAETPDHELAHGISLTVFKGALESLIKACTPGGWAPVSPTPTSRDDKEIAPPAPPSPSGNPRPLPGYKRQIASSPIPPKSRAMDLPSPIPPAPPEEVYAEYGFSGLVEFVERELGEDDDADEWETVDEDWDGQGLMVDAEELEFGPELDCNLSHRLDPAREAALRLRISEAFRLEAEFVDSQTAPATDEHLDADDVDDDVNDADLPTAYGYEHLDSDDSGQGRSEWSDNQSGPSEYDPDVDNTPQVLEKLARYIVQVDKLVEQGAELEELPSSTETSEREQSGSSPGADDERETENELDVESTMAGKGSASSGSSQVCQDGQTRSQSVVYHQEASAGAAEHEVREWKGEEDDVIMQEPLD